MSLDATVGGSSSNSYVTVEEATTYFAGRAYSSDWDSFEDKEAILITSSSMLDWYFSWKGFKATDSQSMDWPRISVALRDGSVLSSTIIPNQVKVAVFELALSSLSGDRTLDSSLYGIEMVQVSTLKVQTSKDSSSSTEKSAIPEKVSKILKDLYNRSTLSVVRLMRA